MPRPPRVLERLGCTPADLTTKESRRGLGRASRRTWTSRALAKELGVGTLTLKDILAQLARPGRDPREDLPAAGVQTGRAQAGRPRARHGIDRHGAERGRFRLLRRHRHARQRPGPRQPPGRPLHPRSARSGGRGRHRQGVGAGGGQGAAAGVADDGAAGQRASTTPDTRRTVGRWRTGRFA